MLNELPPLSLYIHIPWCVKKCPYCDFNSHTRDGALPVASYVKSLIEDLQQDAQLAQERQLTSIFFGGGTPSLLPGEAIKDIVDAARDVLGFAKNIEITLEANPGTVEYSNFAHIRQAGVNRLSMGIQSFNDLQLKKLGRIHDAKQALQAYQHARDAGFTNINLDLMHGLPAQSIADAERDLLQAIELQPEHISWYQLTIEANTEFYSRPPTLPTEDCLLDIFEQGQQILFEHGYQQYETSAYAAAGRQSQHNLNYWRFGDYLAIGAGAHGKISLKGDRQIMRYQKTRLPEHYMSPERAYTCSEKYVSQEELPLEFAMNALRLKAGVGFDTFCKRTGLPLSSIDRPLANCRSKGLIETSEHTFVTTELGYRFLNSVLNEFMDP